MAGIFCWGEGQTEIRSCSMNASQLGHGASLDRESDNMAYMFIK